MLTNWRVQCSGDEQKITIETKRDDLELNKQ